MSIAHRQPLNVRMQCTTPTVMHSGRRQADQGLKHKRRVSLKFNGNCYHIRVDELCKYEQDLNVKGKGWIYWKLATSLNTS